MKQENDKSLDRAISAKRESKYLDFKEKFDPNQAEDWCEIIKDIVAITNSGGGMIIIGVKNDGSPSKEDVSAVLRLDPAKITDKIAKYTGDQFGDFSIQEADRKGHKIAVLQTACVPVPMVFIQPGTYDVGERKQKTAFSRGSIYFRHGAKSEPGNSKDLREWVERELERIRKLWLVNIRKVVYAPTGYKVELLPPQVWDEAPYRSPQEMVVGIMKSWKRNKSSYASETDIWTLYASRNSLDLDEERAEALLESAINRHAPFFFWAKLLSSLRLKDFIKRIAKDGKYPAPNMAAKLAHAIGGKVGTELLDYIAKNCNYLSTKNRTDTLKKSVSHKNALKKVYGTKVKLKNQSIDIENKRKSELENILNGAIKENAKSEVKRLDAIVYGVDLQANREK